MREGGRKPGADRRGSARREKSLDRVADQGFGEAFKKFARSVLNALACSNNQGKRL